ncbi:MAG: hypothetical protein V4725_13020 [Bacteroidota bacterium]
MLLPAMMTKNQLPNILAYAVESDDGEKNQQTHETGIIRFSGEVSTSSLNPLEPQKGSQLITSTHYEKPVVVEVFFCPSSQRNPVTQTDPPQSFSFHFSSPVRQLNLFQDKPTILVKTICNEAIPSRYGVVYTFLFCQRPAKQAHAGTNRRI